MFNEQYFADTTWKRCLKSEDLPRLIAKAKGWKSKYRRGRFYWVSPYGEEYTRSQWKPHTDANQALQLLCEIDYHISNEDVYAVFHKEETVLEFPHNNTPELICQAICLGWLAAHGVDVELIEE